ncbi:hypothetical protein ANN_19621 [Periplaneta americana]|uniref:Uncharacterized protein n=1 Tax=Periplaneta americana TaxID=6978 RepID=A0ABQ8SAL7_PERAM|nr:hypothetical protein ANN_19621 [Periplaneta americana]
MAGLCEGGNEPPGSLKAISKKWGWLGHTLRRPPDDPARKALDWNPQGSRGIGRPKIGLTWKRTVLTEAKTMGKTWSEIKELARNRKKPQPGNLPRTGIEPGPSGFAARRANRYSTGVDRRRSWEDIIKMEMKKVRYDGRNWINLTQDRDRWRAYLRATMNLQVP